MAPGHDVLAIGELVRLFRRLRPDIVHTHNPKPGLYGRLAARIAGVPVIVNTVHGLYATPEDSGPRRAVVYSLERAASLCSQAELVQNPEDLAVLSRLGVPEDKLVLLGNGVDLGRFAASTRGRRTSAGRGPPWASAETASWSARSGAWSSKRAFGSCSPPPRCSPGTTPRW